MNRRRAILATTAVALCPRHAISQAVLAQRPDIKVGDRWIYNRVDYWTNLLQFAYELEVTFASEKAIITSVRYLSDARQTNGYSVQGVQVPEATWTADWNAMSDVEGRVISPHTGLLEFPLISGGRRLVNYTIEAQRPAAFAAQERREIKIEGWEEITVPAGRFTAIKISAVGSVRNPALGKYGPARNFLWYSPTVKRWVKALYESIDYKNHQVSMDSIGRIHYRDGDELVDYRPRVK